MHVDCRETRQIVACKILAILLKITYLFILINGFLCLIDHICVTKAECYNLTYNLMRNFSVARVKTFKFISGALFCPTGQLVIGYWSRDIVCPI